MDPLHILLVDDDPLAHPVYGGLLMAAFGEDARLSIADHPEDAMRRVLKHPRDQHLVVLSDLDLHARTDGIQLLGAVARVRPDSVRLLYSARPRADIEARIGDRPVHGVLEKSLDHGAFMREIRDLVRARLGRPQAS